MSEELKNRISELELKLLDHVVIKVSTPLGAHAAELMKAELGEAVYNHSTLTTDGKTFSMEIRLIKTAKEDI